MTIKVDAELAEQLHSHIAKRRDDPNGEMAEIKRYLEGDHLLPYMPATHALAAFEDLARRSISNWLPLVSDTFVKRLFVEGYRPTGTLTNSDPWDYWQANRLDARQTIVHRAAIEYGEAFVLVLPGKAKGKKTPVIQPLQPMSTVAFYSDDDDEWPYVAARQLTDRVDGKLVLEIYDETNVYTFEQDKEYFEPGANGGAAGPVLVKPEWTLAGAKKHGLGVVPIVRFREALDDRCHGAIKPLIPDQQRINEIVFATHMAIQYSVFRQRYATGIVFDEDANGNPINPFRAGNNTIWTTEQEQAKFGEFAQTDISGHLNAYTKAVQTLAAHAQIDPNLLTGDVINVSSEALGSLQDSTTQRLNVYKMIFGEAWEQVFRLAALAAGDTKAAEDESAQTRWRDDTQAEFLKTVQGLALLVKDLGVPERPLWSKIPGFSDQDIESWEEAADAQSEQDPMAQLLAGINTQATTPPVLPGQQPVAPQGVTVPGQTAVPPLPGQSANPPLPKGGMPRGTVKA